MSEIGDLLRRLAEEADSGDVTSVNWSRQTVMPGTTTTTIMVTVSDPESDVSANRWT